MWNWSGPLLIRRVMRWSPSDDEILLLLHKSGPSFIVLGVEILKLGIDVRPLFIALLVPLSPLSVIVLLQLLHTQLHTVQPVVDGTTSSSILTPRFLHREVLVSAPSPPLCWVRCFFMLLVLFFLISICSFITAWPRARHISGWFPDVIWW